MSNIIDWNKKSKKITKFSRFNYNIYNLFTSFYLQTYYKVFGQNIFLQLFKPLNLEISQFIDYKYKYGRQVLSKFGLVCGERALTIRYICKYISFEVFVCTSRFLVT